MCAFKGEVVTLHPRNHPVRFMVSERDYQVLVTQAKAWGVPVSECIRRVLFAGAEPIGVKAKEQIGV